MELVSPLGLRRGLEAPGVGDGLCLLERGLGRSFRDPIGRFFLSAPRCGLLCGERVVETFVCLAL